MNTWEGVVWCTFWVLEEAEMWLSKVSRRAFKSNAISNIFIRFCIRCNYLYGAWLFRISGKRKGWKPLIRLGFQPLLSSVKVWYFPLKSEFVKRLENRLPKRHGGSNPSSCAIKTNTIPRGWGLFLYHSQRGRTLVRKAKRGVRIPQAQRIPRGTEYSRYLRREEMSA